MMKSQTRHVPFPVAPVKVIMEGTYIYKGKEASGNKEKTGGNISIVILPPYVGSAMTLATMTEGLILDLYPL